jgi:hypothetical protein
VVGGGTHNYTAEYSGDANYAGSTSPLHSVTVDKLASITNLSASSTTVNPGKPVLLTAQVTGSGPVPQGSVTFYELGVAISGSTTTLASGKATFTVTPSAGVHKYTAEYSGNGDYVGGSSFTVTVNVVDAPLPSDARLVDQKLGLQPDPSGLWRDWAGLGEKWLRAANKDWYFITPSGHLYKWDNVTQGLGKSLLDSVLDPLYHIHIDLLYDAASQTLAADLDQRLGLVLRNSLWFDWGKRQEKWIFGTNTGQWCFITPDGRLFQWDGSSEATGILLATLATKYYDEPDLLYGVE